MLVTTIRKLRGKSTGLHFARAIKPCTLHTFCVARSSLFTLDLLLTACRTCLGKTFPRLTSLCDAPGWVNTFAGNNGAHNRAILKYEAFAFARNFAYFDNIFRLRMPYDGGVTP